MTMLRRALISLVLAGTALLAWGGAASAYGAVIHVASHGADSADGSQSAPLRSLQHAVAIARPGDRVAVGAGSYAGFRMTTSGSAGAPISITAAEGAGRPRIVPGGSSNSIVLLDSVHDVNLSGLEIVGNPTRWGAGIRVRGGSSRIELSNLEVHDNRSFAVLLEDVTDVVLSASRLSKNETGLQVSRAGTGIRIVNNDVHDNDRMIVDDEEPNNDRGANGMVFYRTTGPITVAGNRVWANRAISHDYGFDGGAFEVYAASGLTIRDNVAWNNQNVMETGTDGSLPCARNNFTGNVAYGGSRNGPAGGLILRCASDMVVSDNTFDDLDRFAFYVTAAARSFGGSVDGLSITRNIAVSRVDKLLSIGSELPPSVVIDENLLFNRSGGYIASFPGRGNTRSMSTFTSWSGMQARGVQADPLFVDPGRADFRLRAESPVPNWGARQAALEPALQKFPAKLQIERARVERRERRLDVLAPITGLASGEVQVEFFAAKRRFSFTEKVAADDRRIKFRRSIPVEQARLGTGIVTINYPGDKDTRPQEVRLRAASQKANLQLKRPVIEDGRLKARGTISDRARGVVRLQLQYVVGGQTETVEVHGRIDEGRWTIDERLSDQVVQGIAQRTGSVHSYTLFTGYFPRRIRGEMQSYQVLGDR
jgi:hypothetical protein